MGKLAGAGCLQENADERVPMSGNEHGLLGSMGWGRAAHGNPDEWEEELGDWTP